jgi:hypothetical protein
MVKVVSKKIIDRVTVCIILHNLLLGSSYPEEWVNVWDEDLEEEDIEYEYEEQFVPIDMELAVDAEELR